MALPLVSAISRHRQQAIPVWTDGGEPHRRPPNIAVHVGINVIDGLCAGEDAVRDDFNELWRVIGTEWGSPSKFDFYPDLRGLFLRGWDHGRKTPDGTQYQVEPYTGDLDIAHRVNPRPEVASVSGADPGATGDHVGSLQPDLVGPHHGYGYTDYANAYHLANDDHTAQNILGDGQRNKAGTTQINTSHDLPSTETHPSNGYVMYFIYVGKPATIIQLLMQRRRG